MRRRGFTLLEMMLVVVIIGIMSALALGGIQGVMNRGRVNGTSRSLAQAFANARTRAMAMSCAVGVQVSGTTYNPGSWPAGFPQQANIVVFRKNVCDPAAPLNPYFEPGDKILQSSSFDSSYGVLVQVPAVITTNGGKLMNSAFVVTWSMVGGVLTRNVYEDSSGSGVFSVTTLGAADLMLDVTDKGQTVTAQAVLPAQGAPHAL